MNLPKNIIFLFLNVFYFFFLLISCERPYFNTSSDARLRFSTDTISFDTVLNTIVTPSKKLMVYNPYDQAVQISLLSMEGGTQSPFKLNIDGTAGNSAKEIEILPHDSMYIFIQLKNNVQNQDLPAYISDKLNFVINGHSQQVILKAWGQDVIVLRNAHLTSQTLTNNKPYLVYGSLTIDPGALVILNAGTRLYFHDTASLVVKGSLQAMGTLSKPVVMCCDRFDYLLPDIPYSIMGGMWRGITFQTASQNNILNYTQIRNAISAIYFNDSTLQLHTRIEISNSKIENNSFCGILAQNTQLKLSNTIISNSGSYLFRAVGGGSYEFIHCTLANYYELGGKGTESVYLSNSSDNKSNPLTVFFGNSVITGYGFNELLMVKSKTSSFNYLFQNSFIKVSDFTGIDTINSNHFTHCIYSSGTRSMFKAYAHYKYDFMPDSLSILINKGSDSIASLYPTDLKGNTRTTGKPDIGAIEYFKK